MTDSHLFQEIEEDLQRQRYEQLWKRHGKHILGGALLIVLVTAFINGWQTWRTQRDQSATTGVLTQVEDKAADSTKKREALVNFAQVHTGLPQATLAQLHAAELAVQDGHVDKALPIYDAVANDAKAEPALRSLASLLAVEAQFDKGDPAELRTRLAPLIAEGIWRNMARELGAHLALRANDKVEAKKLFTELTIDQTVSPVMQERARDMLRSLDEGS